jgi:hypothetical protein
MELTPGSRALRATDTDEARLLVQHVAVQGGDLDAVPLQRADRGVHLRATAEIPE